MLEGIGIFPEPQLPKADEPESSPYYFDRTLTPVEFPEIKLNNCELSPEQTPSTELDSLPTPNLSAGTRRASASLKAQRRRRSSLFAKRRRSSTILKSEKRKMKHKLSLAILEKLADQFVIFRRVDSVKFREFLMESVNVRAKGRKFKNFSMVNWLGLLSDLKSKFADPLAEILRDIENDVILVVSKDFPKKQKALRESFIQIITNLLNKKKEVKKRSSVTRKKKADSGASRRR
jgi:hypothetical protein